MKDKEFTSHKAKHALQFDTNIFLIWNFDRSGSLPTALATFW
jgi:hypothetical protein